LCWTFILLYVSCSTLASLPVSFLSNFSNSLTVIFYKLAKPIFLHLKITIIR
jgi:hypothetical protein